MSWIESAYYSRYYFFYEGELSAYKYAWDVTVSVDESKVYEENREAVRQIVSALDQIAAGAMVKILIRYVIAEHLQQTCTLSLIINISKN